MNTATQMKGRTKVWGNGWQIRWGGNKVEGVKGAHRDRLVRLFWPPPQEPALLFFPCTRTYSSFNPSFGVFMLLIIHQHSGQTVWINYPWFCKQDDKWTAEKGLHDFRRRSSVKTFPSQTEHICYDGGRLRSPAATSRLAGINDSATSDLMMLEGRKRRSNCQ